MPATTEGKLGIFFDAEHSTQEIVFEGQIPQYSFGLPARDDQWLPRCHLTCGMDAARERLSPQLCGGKVSNHEQEILRKSLFICLRVC